jgi:hypothetical protein
MTYHGEGLEGLSCPLPLIFSIEISSGLSSAAASVDKWRILTP